MWNIEKGAAETFEAGLVGKMMPALCVVVWQCSTLCGLASEMSLVLNLPELKMIMNSSTASYSLR